MYRLINQMDRRTLQTLILKDWIPVRSPQAVVKIAQIFTDTPFFSLL